MSPLRSFRNFSINRKLTLIVMVASTVALLLACALLLVFDFLTFREGMVEDLDVVAEGITINIRPALDFGDPQFAEDILAGLAVRTNVVAACVFVEAGSSGGGLLGDSADFDFTPYENRMDMVFVDGSHAYSYVVNDTHVARRLLRDGRGVIVWHDYADGPAAFTGVVKALHEFQESDPYYRNMRRIQGTSLVVLAHA